MKLSFLALIIISLSFALYYTFTIYQETKITLETEKPPERKKTHEEERIPEGARPQESKRLPDVVWLPLFLSFIDQRGNQLYRWSDF